MFGANEMKSSSGLQTTDTSIEVSDLRKQLEKARKDLQDLQGKQIKEKASREKLQQQLFVFARCSKGVPKFIDTFKGFIVDMEMSRLKHNW